MARIGKGDAAEVGGGMAAAREHGADFLYLQEDYTVTNGVVAGEEIIFADLTPAWLEFCRDTLKFEPPVRKSAMAAMTQDKS